VSRFGGPVPRDPVGRTGSDGLHGPHRGVGRAMLTTSPSWASPTIASWTTSAIVAIGESSSRTAATRTAPTTDQEASDGRRTNRRKERKSGARPLPTRSGRKRPPAGRPGRRSARPRPAGGGHRDGGKPQRRLSVRPAGWPGRCGGMWAVAVAGYILHLRESTPRSGGIAVQRRSGGDSR
jgi:hypothetical protein